MIEINLILIYMYTTDKKLYVARSSEGPVCIAGKMANRHGLIAGATGTGKTVSLQVLAETFSQAGVPCFMADMKGDLSGISQPGRMTSFIEKRAPEFEIPDPVFEGCPVRFFDVYGEQGHPMRATVSQMGPIMLSRLLELSDVQEGVLNAVFKIADEKGWLLIDLKDLRMMLDYAGRNAAELSLRYGNLTSRSIGAIQRALLVLESQGAEKFFGEPAFNIFDLIQTEGGRGVMNILAADRLMQHPKLYSTFLLWLLSELYSQLPEVGDGELPKLIFFFDEAHMLFDDTAKAVVDKIEQVVRLIRSKGVGVYFITQSPSDIPENVLGQLGNRVQHALRAFTPRDQKAVKSAAQTFRPNAAFKTEEAIMELGTGEALVSFLDESGTPMIVQRAKMLFPLSSIGPVSGEVRESIIRKSRLYGMYERSFDRESAYEIITAMNDKAQAEARREAQEKEEAAARQKEARQRAQEQAARQKSREPARKTTSGRSSSRKSPVENLVGSAATAIGRNLGNSIVRGILGTLFKK